MKTSYNRLISMQENDDVSNFSKSICFLMPTKSLVPAGGFKVVYEYANRFVKDNYDVKIIYPAFNLWKEASISKKIIRIVKYFLFLMIKIKWFPIDKRVKQKVVWNLSEKHVPQADVYIATGAVTAEYLSRYKRQSKKIYFIQGYELWEMPEKRLHKTYTFPLEKIVVSTWLKKIIEKEGQTATLVNNGFDFNYFKKHIDTEHKDKFTIAMIYHTLENKRSADGFEALKIVKQKYPQIKVNIFGAFNKPNNLPNWYKYYKTPNKEIINHIYNVSAIFIGTSADEGWGLPVGEAMICGCAVVCTDIAGYREMAINNETALTVPVKSPQLLANEIIHLIEDSTLRFRIANAGTENIKKFRIDDMYKKFRDVVQNI